MRATKLGHRVAVVALGLIVEGSPPFVFLLILPYMLFFAFVIGMPVALPVALVGAWVLRRVASRWRLDDGLTTA